MSSAEMSLAASGMQGAKKGAAKKPPKVIMEMTHRRTADGRHQFVHHHANPEHHPEETHTMKKSGKAGDDEAVDHFIKHATAANPGEGKAEAEPGGEAAEEMVGGGEGADEE